MQRTNSTRLTSTPTATPHLDHSKIEVLWLSGPNQFGNEQALLQSLLKKTNLARVVLGDGKSTLSTDEIKQVITERLTSSSHIFLNGHGNVMQGKHFIQLGNLNIEKNNTAIISSHDLLRMLQNNSSNTDKKKKTLHIAACHAGAMRNEIQPGSKIWQQAYLMLYSGKKSSFDTSAQDSIAASLHYLNDCKASQIEADPLDLFLHAINVQSDCITLMGGDLHAPLISHAPKNTRDLYRQGRDNRIQGHSEDLARLDQHKQKLYSTLTLTYAEKLKQLQGILFARIERHDSISIREILGAEPSLINCQNENGLSPLQFACEEEKIEIVNLLIESGADINIKTPDLNTPLIFSVMQKNLLIAKTLLEHGASLSDQNNEGEQALFIAAAMGQKIMVQLLLKYDAADFIDQLDLKGNTALIVAVKNSNAAIVKLLLSAGAKTSIKNKKGQTALSIANHKNDHHIAELIRQKKKSENRPSINSEILKLPDDF